MFSAAASSLCLHGHVGLLFCRGLLGDGGWPAGGLRRGGRSPHALLLAGGRSRGPGGVESPVLGQRRGRGRRRSCHGGHGAAAVEALGGFEAGEHGEGIGEVRRRGRRVGGSAHLREGDAGVRRGGGGLHLLPPTRTQHKTPLPPSLQHTELPDPRSADDAGRKQQLFKTLKTNAVVRAPVRGPREDPVVPGQVGDPLYSTASWCHPGRAAFWLSGRKAQAQLPPRGRVSALRPCRALALHTYCTLQIPNCPRESNEATAASKSLRHICPGRLWVARARKLKGPSLGTAGRERRQAAPMHMCALVFTHIQTSTLYQRHTPVGQRFARSVAPASTQGLACAAGQRARTSACVYTAYNGPVLAPGSPRLSLPR